MTWYRWSMSTVCFLLALGTFWYAVHQIHGSLGMVVLLAVYVVGFAWLVNTIDLLCGRWLRRGPRGGLLRTAPSRRGEAAPPGRIRRIIIEEIYTE